MAGELKKYRVRVNGNETVMKLNDEDAKVFRERGELVDDGAAAVADTDGRGDEQTAPATKRRSAVMNKARSADDSKV